MGTNEAFRRGRSVVSALHVHLVFVTKYRCGVLNTAVRATIAEAAGIVCHKFGAILKETDGEDDHIHLLIEYPPQVQLSKLVNSLKGVSSRMARKHHLPHLRKRLWGGHLWSPSYFAASCGGAPIGIVRAYIERQRDPRRQRRRGRT